MEKGSEDEAIVGGPATLNGISPEILFLLDSAQGLCLPEGNTLLSVTGEPSEEPRGRRPQLARLLPTDYLPDTHHQLVGLTYPLRPPR